MESPYRETTPKPANDTDEPKVIRIILQIDPGPPPPEPISSWELLKSLWRRITSIFD